MKKIVLALCLVSSLAIKLEAQNSNPTSSTSTSHRQREQLSAEDRAKKDAEMAEKKLALSPDQKSKWEAASLERVKANESLKIKMNGSTTPEERKEIHQQMKVNKDKFDTSVSAMLTPDQKTKYEQMRNDRKGHGQHMKGNRPGMQQNGSSAE
jgi:Spy/CpxP family protein refolding chaperone